MLTWSSNAVEEALGLGAKAVLRISFTTAPNEVGALVGGWLVAPLVDVLLAGTRIPGTSTLLVLIVLGQVRRSH